MIVRSKDIRIIQTESEDGDTFWHCLDGETEEIITSGEGQVIKW